MKRRTGRAALICLALVITAIGVNPVTPTASPIPEHDPFVLQNVRLFDGVHVTPHRDVYVVDGHITEVGQGLELPPGARVIDGTGHTLLPGLIDAHTHVISPEALEQALTFGVTTELDMFTSWQMADAIKRDQAEGRRLDAADLRSAGTLVTAPGGHGTQFGLAIPTITGPDQAVEFVDARIQEGSDYIKIVYDDGEALERPIPTLSKETLAAVVQATHARDMMAVVHITSLKAARDAIEVGADGLVHMFLAEEEDPTFGEYAARHEVFIVPTLSVLQSACGATEGRVLAQDENLAPYLSASTTAALRQRFPGPPGTEQAFARVQTTVRQLDAAGVAILAGSDAPNPGTGHGASIHRELELLVESGLTPLKALQAATSVPAVRFHLEDRGRILPGMRADLVLVDGDPTLDIKETRNIVAVWKQGVELERKRQGQPDSSNQPASGESEKGIARGLVSDFEGGDLSVGFGAGWSVSTDQMRGGTSTAELNVVAGGAEDSRHSLSILGEIKGDPGQTWAGALFSPGAAPMAPADLSSKESIAFWTKGDGGSYFIMLFLQSEGSMPVVQTFVSGPQWTRVEFSLADFNGTNAHDLIGVFLGGGGQPGEFGFHVDDLRFEGTGSGTAELQEDSGERDTEINNLVHPEGYQSAPLGSLGRLEVVGSGPNALIMIPGFGMDAEVFRPLSDLLETEYRMFLVTPAGFGDTPAPPMPDGSLSYGDRTWCRAFEDAVWSLVEEEGLDRPLLVGFVDGFQHAMRIAIDHPGEIGGMVSISGELVREFGWSVSPDDRPRTVDNGFAKGWFKRVSQTTWSEGQVRPEWYSASPDIAKRLFDASEVPSIPTQVRYLCEKWSYDPRPELKHLQVPILALLPDRSEYSENSTYQLFLENSLVGPWEALGESDRVKIITIPGARSGMLLGHTDTIAAKFEDFVKLLP